MRTHTLTGTLPAAVLGNGSLLATLSTRGRVEQLWWPHPDRARHLGALRIAIEVDGLVRWVDEEPFSWSQDYVRDALTLRTVARAGDLEVAIDDLVDDMSPVLVRRISCSVPGARLVVECRPELGEHTRALGAQVTESGALVFYRSPYALALDTSAKAEATCSAVKDVEGALACPLEDSVELACALGCSPAEAVARSAAALAVGFEELTERRRRVDAARLDAAEPAEAGADEGLYRRSLLVFDVLADRETGAVVAAPELDPDFVHSGGYGFVWPRDLAFLVLAFLSAGRFDLAERALGWLAGAQEENGMWLQRHWTDGSLAPSWCRHQIDETGSVLFAYEAMWRERHDVRLDDSLWPSTRRGADFLLSTLDDAGIPAATADLWEEREGCHAYTAAAVVGGLRAGASFAQRHEHARADRYARAAERLAAAIDRSFWSDEEGRYLRTLGDPTADVSLLGLAWPFGAVDPAGPRMRATAAAIRRVLGRPGGGVARYDDDRYAGGNSWVLAALWLGLWDRQTGDSDGHTRALAYAQRVATPLGLLAEQVGDDGRPTWVLPLAWSHAMFVLACRPELELVREPAAVDVASPVRVEL